MRMLILLLIPFSLLSQKMNPRELTAWYHSEEYPLQYRVSNKGVVFTLKALTPEVIVARQLVTGDIDKQEAQKLLQSNKGISSYELRIELPVSKDIYNYVGSGDIGLSDRAYYWAFDCIKDFSVVSDKGESFDCGFALTEKGVSGCNTAIVSLDFPIYLSNTSKIAFLDKALTGSQIVFEIPEQLTYKQPKLIL